MRHDGGNAWKDQGNWGGLTAVPLNAMECENFFAENAFLGVNHLPSLHLNAIQTLVLRKNRISLFFRWLSDLL
jgi:hypothetical protein